MKSNISNFSILTVLAAVLLSACATRLDSVSPANVDFSGRWVLDKNASQTVLLSAPGSGQQNSSMGGGMGGGMGGDRQEPQGDNRSLGGPGLTPAMKSLEMTIEQNHDSMGIAYPDELYRDVDWGKKEFYRETVSAGWQADNLIVISASDQMTLTETYRLNPAQDILNLTISIKDQRGTNQFIRVFNLQK